MGVDVGLGVLVEVGLGVMVGTGVGVGYKVANVSVGVGIGQPGTGQVAVWRGIASLHRRVTGRATRRLNRLFWHVVS